MAVLALALAACSDKTDPPADPDPRITERERAKAEDFDPSAYPHSCTTDADCVVVTAIGSCFTCCGDVAVRSDSTAVADSSSVRMSCGAHGGMVACARPCSPTHATCTKGDCRADVDDAGP